MVEVICDTNFLIHLSTRRIKNIDNLDQEIGSISFVVPEVVLSELFKLQSISSKKQDIIATLEFIKNMKIVPIFGSFADDELINYVKTHNSFIATMDKILKKKIKQAGGSVISFSNNKIVLEP